MGAIYAHGVQSKENRSIKCGVKIISLSLFTFYFIFFFLSVVFPPVVIRRLTYMPDLATLHAFNIFLLTPCLRSEPKDELLLEMQIVMALFLPSIYVTSEQPTDPKTNPKLVQK